MDHKLLEKASTHSSSIEPLAVPLCTKQITLQKMQQLLVLFKPHSYGYIFMPNVDTYTFLQTKNPFEYYCLHFLNMYHSFTSSLVSAGLVGAGMRQVIVYGIIRGNKDRVVPASRQVGSRCLHFNRDKKRNIL